MHEQAQILKTLIETRRSVKPGFYTHEKVDDTIINEILESARWAPTHGLTEPWRFFVFSGDGLKALAHELSKIYKEHTATENFLQAKYDKISTNITKTSHIIMLGMKRQVQGKIPETEEICAVACAVQNMMLTAHAHNIGTYWSTGSMSTHKATKKFLGLEEKDLSLGMLYVSKYSGIIPVPNRTEIQHKTTWFT